VMSERRKQQLLYGLRKRFTGRSESDQAIVDYSPFKTTLVYRLNQRFSAPGIGQELVLIQGPSPGAQTSLKGFDSYESGQQVRIVLYRTRTGRYVERISGAQFVVSTRKTNRRNRAAKVKLRYSEHTTSIVPTAPPPVAPPPPPRRKGKPSPNKPRL